MAEVFDVDAPAPPPQPKKRSHDVIDLLEDDDVVILAPPKKPRPEVVDVDALDFDGADVRKPNVDGVIGDAKFNALLGKLQTRLSTQQLAVRAGIFGAAFAPWAVLRTLTKRPPFASAKLNGAAVLGVLGAAAWATRASSWRRDVSFTFSRLNRAPSCIIIRNPSFIRMSGDAGSCIASPRHRCSSLRLLL